jgi:hypothetical protein
MYTIVEQKFLTMAKMIGASFSDVNVSQLAYNHIVTEFPNCVGYNIPEVEVCKDDPRVMKVTTRVSVKHNEFVTFVFRLHEFTAVVEWICILIEDEPALFGIIHQSFAELCGERPEYLAYFDSCKNAAELADAL